MGTCNTASAKTEAKQAMLDTDRTLGWCTHTQIFRSHWRWPLRGSRIGFFGIPPGLKSGDQIVTTTPQKKVKQDATRKQKPFYSLNDATSCYTLLIASRPLTQWKSLVRIQCRPSIISRGYRLRSVGSFCFCYPNKPTQEKTRDNKRKISCQFSY